MPELPEARLPLAAENREWFLHCVELHPAVTFLLHLGAEEQPQERANQRLGWVHPHGPPQQEKLRGMSSSGEVGVICHMHHLKAPLSHWPALQVLPTRKHNGEGVVMLPSCLVGRPPLHPGGCTY